jgi:putative acetyltransferase
LGELTLVVRPGYQGEGIGTQIFTALLNIVKEELPEIFRVELIVRESNTKAIALYQSLGFVIEGKLTGRIKNENGRLEADIPMAWLKTGN